MTERRRQYPFESFEPKWQRHWREKATFATPNPGDPGFDASKPKYYVLDMFPYPSGTGLHVGHPEGYTATDIVARFKRMAGCNVLHPMGWDAFGLPAEQYAIKTGQHPRVTTEQNIARFRQQLQAIGFSYDWAREVNTTDPAYFRWTQWIFWQLYHAWFNPESKKAEPISTYLGAEPDSVRLAYVAEVPVNWCPELGTVLANEEVVEGKSEVGGFPVERRPMRQWMLRITALADRLIDELDTLDWPESIKLLQRNWIGRSEGAQVDFALEDSEKSIAVFTTRPDTLYGATYMVLAPEHALVDEIASPEQQAPITAYRELATRKSDLERTELAKEKSGVFTGGYALNPVNGERIPIWIADYVLAGYGTGAIMAVPAHDERDWEFAKKFGLEIRRVVAASRSADVPSASPSHFLDSRAETKITRHRLSHWQQSNRYYFITWRLADSLPAAKMAELNQARETWLQANPRPWDPDTEAAYHRNFSSRIDEWLDAGTGECWLRQPENAAIVAAALTHFDGQRYDLRTFVVMPNHVHVLVRLFPEQDLPKTVQGWKSFTAKTINGRLGREGKVWQEDYFDRLIRDEAHLFRAGEYIARNPVKAGLLGGEFVLFNQKGEADGTSALLDPGFAVNSPLIEGLATADAKSAMIAWLEEHGHGRGTVNYKLRDWLFSRQRYWGEPFPIYWENGRHHAVPSDQLPVLPPRLDDFKPTGTPEPPLSKAAGWVRYSDTARRECNTMPQWAGSCWYYLRYCDPRNPERFISEEAERYWMNVDLYIGGTEHAVLHLLYARFWHKVMFDLGYLTTAEPFQRLVNQGIILGEDGVKMSKSRGNVVNPDDVISLYGADAFRLYEMFMGPLEQMKPWSMTGVEGVYRFLARVWRLVMEETQTGDWQLSAALAEAEPTKKQLRVIHRTIRKVTEDIEALSFNTAIAEMMKYVNEFTGAEQRPLAAIRFLLQILNPFAPHLTEELWSLLTPAFPGFEGELAYRAWPRFDEQYLVEDEIEIVIQFNGKLRDKITVEPGASKEQIELAALESAKIVDALAGKAPRKVIVVPGKLVNVVG